jgi:anti-anti-sigma factor
MPIASVRYDRSGHVVRLDLAGQIRGAAAVRLQLTILGVIIAEQPNELIIDLHAATTLSNSGVYALTTGYRAAIEYGTRFRVINAEHQVDRALRAAGCTTLLPIATTSARYCSVC